MALLSGGGVWYYGTTECGIVALLSGGGGVRREVKTDEGKTSPLISVKQLPRSPSVNLSISFSLFLPRL